MIAILLTPAFLSSLLLAAHLLREGSFFIAIFAFLFPFTLGAIEWVYTLMQFVIERQEAGQPWVRLSIILGAVAILTVSSASAFSFSSSLRKRYGLSKELIE